jgi:trimeric autotransporter adhesin
VAITPTVMIAAQGMLSGQGIGVSADMTSKISGAVSSPINSGITSLQAQATALAGTDPVSAAAITAALSSLPSAFTSVASAASSAASQASSMVPDVKSFINIHNSSTAFGSASMEYGAALAEFGNKSFGDLGIGVKSFVDSNSGGLTSLVPGLGSLAAKAKTDAFGGLAGSLDPTALLKGQAQAASSALGDGLKSVGQGIGNFGSLFDFKNPQKLGYQSLVKNLQDQGLADSVGLNDAISTAGFDPKKLGAVPDDVLKQVMSKIQGSDLQKIIAQTGVKIPTGSVGSLADLVDPSKIMPAGALAALGIKPGSGLDGLKSLGNTFTNIGVPMDGASAAKLLSGVQTKVGGYLSNLTSLVPASVSATLKPFLGSGTSPFGTPSMSDMMGSVAGKHTDDFAAAGKQLGSIANSSQGQSVATAMTAVLAAISSGSGLSAALSTLSSASSGFAAQAASNSTLSSALGSITGSMSNVTGHISLENSNLNLAGLALNALPTVLPGSGQILAFASKLHSFGVDKMQIGHSDVFSGVASDGLAGDAIKAALLEGKNVAAMSAMGKTAPSVSNPTKALADANAANIDDFIQAYRDAKDAYAAARTPTLNAKAVYKDLLARSQAEPDNTVLRQQTADAKTTFENAVATVTTASEKLTLARNKMVSAAESAGVAAMNKASEVIQSYLT